MSDHARLSPSSAHRWMSCPGSVFLEMGKPDTSSTYAQWGTAAHALAALCLTDGSDPEGYLGRILETVEVDDEMVSCVHTYIDNIREYAAGNDLMVEQRVNFSTYVGVPDQFGTADAIILTADGEELQVHDLKGGRGVRVDAEHNEQMMLYALGAYDQFAALGDIKRVRMVIHQPRLEHLSEWDCTIDELLAFAKTATVAATKCIDIVDTGVWGLDDLTAGEKQCRFCKAKATCPKLTALVQESVGADFDDLSIADIRAAGQLADLSTAMSAVDLIEGWCKAVRAETERQLLVGEPVSGWKLVQGKRGNRAWTSKEEAEATLKAMRIKHEDMYDYAVISPTSADKLAKAEIIGPRQWPKLQALITQSEGKPSVAPASDKREALVLRTANDFETVDEGADLV
jgi:hypothetical protein